MAYLFLYRIDGVMLNVLSLIVRGLNNPVKRIAILDYLRNQKISIAFLQETHLVKKDAICLSDRFFRVVASSSANTDIALVSIHAPNTFEKIILRSDHLGAYRVYWIQISYWCLFQCCCRPLIG